MLSYVGHCACETTVVAHRSVLVMYAIDRYDIDSSLYEMRHLAHRFGTLNFEMFHFDTRGRLPSRIEEACLERMAASQKAAEVRCARPPSHVHAAADMSAA